MFCQPVETVFYRLNRQRDRILRKLEEKTKAFRSMTPYNVQVQKILRE